MPEHRSDTADEDHILGQRRGFEDEGGGRVASALVEGTIESVFAAEQYSVDTIFEALAHPGRRYVLTYLLQSDGAVSLNDLVDYAETQTATAVDEGFRRRIVIELTHTILPKLEEYGLIEYDMEQQVVEPTEQTPVVEPYLRLALAQQELAAELREG